MVQHPCIALVSGAATLHVPRATSKYTLWLKCPSMYGGAHVSAKPKEQSFHMCSQASELHHMCSQASELHQVLLLVPIKPVGISNAHVTDNSPNSSETGCQPAKPAQMKLRKRHGVYMS